LEGRGRWVKNADKGEKQSGISWIVPAVLIPAFLFALYFYGPKAIGSVFTGRTAQAVHKNPPQTKTEEKHEEVKSKESSSRAQVNDSVDRILPTQVKSPNAQGTTNRLYVISRHRLRGYWEVTLSNGKKYTEGNGLEAVGVEGARVRGEWYEEHPALVGESSFKGFSAPEGPDAGVLRTKTVITPVGTNVWGL